MGLSLSLSMFVEVNFYLLRFLLDLVKCSVLPVLKNQLKLKAVIDTLSMAVIYQWIWIQTKVGREVVGGRQVAETRR